VELIIAFFISVMAGVVCHYICKWLDRNVQQQPNKNVSSLYRLYTIKSPANNREYTLFTGLLLIM